MTADARRRAEEALATMNGVLLAWGPQPPMSKSAALCHAISVGTVALEALLASEPAKGAEAALTRLRHAGWAVAVHNDYRLGGEPHTFWLLTRADGRYVKGEGRTDAIALAQCERASEPAPPASAEVARLTALLRECNAVCLCGCPESEHESYGEDGESCGHDDHECIRVAPAVLEIVQRYRVALSDALAQKPAGAAVREAAEELQRIDNLLARRITLDGLTRVQKIALALRVCEETDPKGEVAARYVCRGGQKGER